MTGVAIETLQPNLVRRARLAAADALDLGRVQRVDLWPALTLLLMANPQREIEQRAKAVFERRVALDLAANITDDAASRVRRNFSSGCARLNWWGSCSAPP